MQRIVVGMFAARRDADRARGALLNEGFHDRQITIEGDGGDAGGGAVAPGEGRTSPNEPLPEDRGLAGFIGRMFSGATMDPTGIERYRHAVGTGRAIVAVHGLDDEDGRRAASILASHGAYGTDVHHLARQEPDVDQSIVARANRAIATIGPDVSSLPNAPSGWGHARGGERSTIGSAYNDPARPEGLTRGAHALGAAADRSRLEGIRGGRDAVQPAQRSGRDPGTPDETGGAKLHGDPLVERIEGPGPDQAIATGDAEGGAPDVAGHRTTGSGRDAALPGGGGPQVPRPG